jgi:hypothetical protein
MGFSISEPLFAGISGPVFPSFHPPVRWSTIGGLGIAEPGPSKFVPAANLPDKVVVWSADTAEKDGLADGTVSELVDLVELVEDEAGEVVVELELELEKKDGGKTTPSTRFAASREASFLSSMRNFESFLGSGGGG